MLGFLLKLLLYLVLFVGGAIVTCGILVKAHTFLTMGRHKIKKSLKGKVIVITGGTAGIGKETVRELASCGATIHVLARDLNKADRVLGEIKQSTGNHDITVHQADLTKFETVRAFAKNFLDTKSRIHVLINNAGAATATKRVTVDGNEETTQANHLSHFLLTHLLLDRLIESGPSRIINVSSAAHFYRTNQFDVFDINYEKSGNTWDGHKAYCWSKLMNILFTRELARRLYGRNVTVNSVHPGAVRTEIMREGDWTAPNMAFMFMKIAAPFLKSSSEGAQTTLYLAASDEVEHVTGQYFVDCQPAAISLLAADDQLAQSLWKESERLIGSLE